MACDTESVISSTDLTNLKSDIQTIDDVVESSLDTTTTKSGKVINTLLGQLKLLGYQPPIAYAGGISFTVADNTKTVELSGVVYAPLPSSLPFTTSGTFVGDDDTRFFVIQGLTASDIAALDLVTKTELALSTGADLVGASPTETVADKLLEFDNYQVSNNSALATTNGRVTVNENDIGILQSDVVALESQVTSGLSGGAAIYVDTTAGLAATVNGEYFNVPSAEADESLILYRNDSGVATEITRTPNNLAVDNAIAAANSLDYTALSPYELVQQNTFEVNTLGVGNFNGGTFSHEIGNSRILVTASAADQGIEFGPDLTNGLTYVVILNFTPGTASGARLLSRWAVNAINPLVSGWNKVEFVADSGGGFGNDIVVAALSSGTFYIDDVHIFQVTDRPNSYLPDQVGDIIFGEGNTVTTPETGFGDYLIVGTDNTITTLPAVTVIGTENIIDNTPLFGAGFIEPAIVIGNESEAHCGRTVAIGYQASAHSVSSTSVGSLSAAYQPHDVALGRGAHTQRTGTAPNQVCIGSENNHDLYIGSGISSRFLEPGTGTVRTVDPTTITTTIHGYNGRDDVDGTVPNIAGGAMRVAGGRSTGTADGGSVLLSVSPASVSESNNKNTLIDQVEVDTNQTANETGMLLLINGTLRRVKLGAADSGGAGLTALVIDNIV